ncbi:hypothetical protein AB6A40_010280 [Gnathostoma spinigerum]|uniref:Uncharacterized protein n=1 Tax=Gnathostoma spinigerum TaxID=75299 RepID=A0ABD6EUN2_9BILA
MSDIEIRMKGRWYYRILMIEDEGSFTLELSNVNLTLDGLIPVAYMGTPYINENVNCILSIGSYNFAIGEPRPFTTLFDAFIHRIVRGKIEKTLCGEVTTAFDSYLRYGIARLALQHKMAMGDILDNGVMSPIYSSEYGLLMYHYGIIQGGNITLRENIPLWPAHDDLTFFVRIEMISDVANAIHKRSLFDMPFTDNIRYNLTVRTLSAPTAEIDRGEILLILRQRFILSNESAIMSEFIEDIIYVLSVHFSHKLQLFFKVIAIRSLDFLSDEMHERFSSKLLSLYGRVIRQNLRIYLPTAAGLVAKEGSLQLIHPYVIFTATML